MPPPWRRPHMDRHCTWEDNPINGFDVLPPVTRQPEDNFCGAQVTVEAFESRARILCARSGVPFPTLSIQHMIDMLKDQLASAENLNEKRVVMMEESTFKLLKSCGVTSKADYDAAPPGQGHVRNVEGIHHYRLRYYAVLYLRTNAWNPGRCKKILASIVDDGPVYGWFLYHESFTKAGGKIYRVPRRMDPPPTPSASDASSSSSGNASSSSQSLGSSEASSSQSLGSSDASQSVERLFQPAGRSSRSVERSSQSTRVRFASHTRCASLRLWSTRENWSVRLPRQLGGKFHANGRGVMETANIVAVITPLVDWSGLFQQ